MTIRITALNPELVYETGSALRDPDPATSQDLAACCEFRGPGKVGDTAAIITVQSGNGDAIDGVVLYAEGCDCGYCLAPHHRLLTSDLLWVPCGEIQEGDELLAFEESPQKGNRNRRWQRTTVLRSEPAMKECVRVRLSNGDVIECSEDHPWLGMLRYADAKYTQMRHWMPARDIGRKSGRKNQTVTVTKIFDTWEPLETFEAGWLCGILDGEASIIMKPMDDPRRSQMRLSVAQAEGPVLDRIVEAFRTFKFDVSITHGKNAEYVYVCGGAEELLRALGSLRPTRLLNNFKKADISNRSIRSNNYVSVLSVEPLGLREVQSIATSSRTYIGEGYLMHNSDVYSDRYCDVEEAGAFPGATITDLSYTISDMPANHTLVIDAAEESVTLTNDNTGKQVGGIDVLDWIGLFEWIRAAKSGCQRICVGIDGATINEGSTDVKIETIDREK